MTKTLFVDAHTFDEHHQGIRTFIKGIYDSIDISSSELQIFLAAYDIENLKAEFSNQAYFKFIKLKSKNKYRRLAFEIPKIIKDYKFDFAHFNYYLPLFLNKKCKYIVTIHDVLFIDYPQYFSLKYRLINTFLFKRSAINANIVTTVSNYSADRIKTNFNLTDKKIEVLPNAVNTKYTLNHDKTVDKIYLKEKYDLDKFIVYVSRIEPRKNQQGLLSAFLEFDKKNKDVELVFIGVKSINNKEFDVVLEKLNAEQKMKIHILENISDKDLLCFYKGAKVFVYPTFAEGFGIPPLEAAALKIPVLCSNKTAMKDFNFFSPYFIDISNVNEFNNRLTDLLNSKNSKKLDKIQNIIREKYSWKRSSEVITSVVKNNIY